MQDRRLTQDDNRGLGQGVLDNQPVLNIFRLLLENTESCTRTQTDHPSGFMTVKAHTEVQTLLHPMEKMVWHKNTWVGVLSSFGDDREPFEKGMEIAVIRDLPHVPSGISLDKSSLGMVVHRSYLEECEKDGHRSGTVSIYIYYNY